MRRLEGYRNSQPKKYEIEPGAVHIWRGLISSALLSDGKFEASLSEDELKRARRFVRQSDADRYIFSHGLLRKILGGYLGCEPKQLRFGTRRYGKPFLNLPITNIEISFNISHSHDMTLIAVSREIEVGIDVEYVRTIKDARQIANRFFSTRERRFLDSFPPKDFDKAFFDCWTSKEAFIKGIGKGLSYPLDSFSVVFSNGHHEVSVSIDGDPDYDDSWSVIRLLPGPGYSGALAIKGPKIEPAFFEFSGD